MKIRTKLKRGSRRIRRRAHHLRDARFGPDVRPDKWVFIVGCPNSGTTLLHDVLATHPSVGSMPREGQLLTDQFVTPEAVGLSRLWALRPEEFALDENSEVAIDLPRLKRQWGARFNAPNRPVLLEKTPVNALRTRWLQRHFENAHFLALVRNGFAVVEGICRRDGHDAESAALQWKRSNEIMLDDLASVQNATLIRYEDMTDSPQNTFGRILEFLELDANGLELTEREWVIHGKASAIINLNNRAIGALSPEQRETTIKVAGPMLQRLGYPTTI